MAHTAQYYYDSANGLITDQYLLPIVEKILVEQKPENVLDVGCGNGSLARYFIEKGFNFYGMDASEKGISFAREYYHDRFFIHDINSNELPEPIKNCKYDLILSTEVIEHVYSPKQFLEFCRSHLKDKGVIVISTPYHGYIKNLVLAASNKMDQHFTALWEGGHIKFWSKNTLSSLLINHGFEVQDFYGAGRLPFLWKSRVITAKKKV